MQRYVDPCDSRAKHLCLTQASVELAQRAVAAVEAVDAEVFGDAASDLLTVLQ